MEMEEKENIENAEMGKRKHSHDTKIVIIMKGSDRTRKIF